MDEKEFMQELQATYLAEAADTIEQCEATLLDLESSPEDESLIQQLFRLAHNLKGSSKSVGQEELGNLAHNYENLLSAIRNHELKAEAHIIDLLLLCADQLKKHVDAIQQDFGASVDHSRIIEQIAHALEANSGQSKDAKSAEPQGESPKNLGEILVEDKVAKPEEIEKAARMQNAKLGEILVEQGTATPAQVATALEKQQKAAGPAAKQEEYLRISLRKIDNILNDFGEQVILQSALEYAKMDPVGNADLIDKTISQLSKITHDLQQTALELRMVSLSATFSKMKRVVRDTSRALDKEIEFVTVGGENELDKTIADAIADPMTHMVRNAADHGIETPDVREAAGKPRKGKIILSAYRRGGFFYLEIKDDGAGLDRNKIVDKAVGLGIISEGAELEDKEALDLVFHSGFSIKEKTTDISGRGVGMDVVKHMISQMKGSCEIESEFGKGSTFIIRLPLTLAIFNGMVVRIGEDKVIFPNSDIEEVVAVNQEEIRVIDNKDSMVKIHDEVLPVINIGKLIGATKASTVVKDDESSKKKTSKTDRLQTLLIKKHEGSKYGLMIDELLSQQKIVLKKFGEEVHGLPGVAGGTILGDGNVALIMEASGLVEYHKNGR